MNRLRARPTFNLFAIAFGLAGLGGALDALRESVPLVRPAGAVAWVCALAVWLALVISYAVHSRLGRTLLADLRHPVIGPFAALVPVVGLMLVSHFSSYLGQPVTLSAAVVLLLASTAFAGWFTARLLGGVPEAGTSEIAAVHPGYLLPTVAGSLVSAVCFATLGAPAVAYALAGVGAMFWIIVTGLSIARAFATADGLGPLTPTLAIHAAPAPVAGLLWLALGTPGGSAVGEVLLGLTVFGVATQVFLVPRYLRLRFAPTFWSFTFSSAAVASFVARWALHEGLPMAVALVPVLAVTVLIVAIAVRHLVDPVIDGRHIGKRASTARPQSAPAASPAPR